MTLFLNQFWSNLSYFQVIKINFKGALGGDIITRPWRVVMSQRAIMSPQSKQFYIILSSQIHPYAVLKYCKCQEIEMYRCIFRNFKNVPFTRQYRFILIVRELMTSLGQNLANRYYKVSANRRFTKKSL